MSCQPAENRRPLLPRHLPRRKTQREILANRSRPSIEIAESDGYRLGYHDVHTSPANYRTSEEWIAWYRGWKRGQQERPR
jgi:molybdopterin biosynthesis enzyme